MSCWLKALPLTLAIVVLSVIAISCNTGNTSQVRFINAVPDTAQYGTALDLEFNGTKDFTGIAFSGYQPASGYTSVPAGGDTIKGFGTGTTTQVFVSNVSLDTGLQYTLVATGFATNASSVAIISADDNNTVPANGKVDFRVIHASPSGPAVDVYIIPIDTSLPSCPSTNCISDLPYRSTSPNVTIPYSTNVVDGLNYTLVVTATGTTTPILSQNLYAGDASAGAICTLVLTDTLNDNPKGMNPLAILLNDLNCANN